MDPFHPPCDESIRTEKDFLANSVYAKYFEKNMEKVESAVRVFGIQKIMYLMSLFSNDEGRQKVADVLTADSSDNSAAIDRLDLIWTMHKGVEKYGKALELMAEIFTNQFLPAAEADDNPRQLLDTLAVVEETLKDTVRVCKNVRENAGLG